MKLWSTLRAFALGIALTSASAAAVTTFLTRDAHAATRRTVCAESLYVRDNPRGTVIGTLYAGQSIDVTDYSPSHQWAYGFAYGHVNKWGWVDVSGLCP